MTEPNRAADTRASAAVVWDWTYEIGNARLEEVYARAKREQWDAEQQLDWTLPVDPAGRILDAERMALMRMEFFRSLPKTQLDTFNAHYSAWILSQLLHGEQGALMVAGDLVSAVPDYEAKLYVASQAMDEARHVEVFARYIRKLDRIYPVQPVLADVLHRIMACTHWQAKMVGMQVILEGLALGTFVNVRAATGCDLLRDALGYVTKDEARHVAFGAVYLGDGIAQMHPNDRATVEDFAFDITRLLVAMRRGMEGMGGFDEVLRDSGIDPREFLEALWKEVAAGFKLAGAPGSVHTLKGIIMPGLVRAGLVSDRVRPRYEQAEIRPFSDTSVLERLEASGTYG